MAANHPVVRLEPLVLIAVGGFLGANARYLFAIVTPGLWGTVLVNTLGSFLLGFVLYEAMHTDMLAEETRLVVATGFLSSFTTYSTFAVETVQASAALAALNVIANYGFGITAALLGGAIARTLEAG